MGFRAGSVQSGRKLCVFPETCLEWPNHAECGGEKSNATPKMKAEKQASSKEAGVFSLFQNLCILTLFLAGKYRNTCSVMLTKAKSSVEKKEEKKKDPK